MTVISTGMASGAYRYKIEARPWLWLLTRQADCLIFQNMSAFDIITKVFRDAGFSDFEDKRQASAGDLVLEYCGKSGLAIKGDFFESVLDNISTMANAVHSKPKIAIRSGRLRDEFRRAIARIGLPGERVIF